MKEGLPSDYRWFQDHPNRRLRIRVPEKNERIYSAADADVSPHEFHRSGMVVCVLRAGNSFRIPIIPHREDRWLRVTQRDPGDEYSLGALSRANRLDKNGYLFYLAEDLETEPPASELLAKVRADVDLIRKTTALIFVHIHAAHRGGICVDSINAELERAGPAFSMSVGVKK